MKATPQNINGARAPRLAENNVRPAVRDSQPQPAGVAYGDYSLSEHLLDTYEALFQLAPHAIGGQFRINEHCKFERVTNDSSSAGFSALPPFPARPHFTDRSKLVSKRNDACALELDNARALWSLASFAVELLQSYSGETLRKVAGENESAPLLLDRTDKQRWADALERVNQLHPSIRVHGTAELGRDIAAVRDEVRMIQRYLDNPNDFNREQERIFAIWACRGSGGNTPGMSQEDRVLARWAHHHNGGLPKGLRSGDSIQKRWWRCWQRPADNLRGVPLTPATAGAWLEVVLLKIRSEREDGELDGVPRVIGAPLEDQFEELDRFGKVPDSKLGYQDLRYLGYAAAQHKEREKLEKYQRLSGTLAAREFEPCGASSLSRAKRQEFIRLLRDGVSIRDGIWVRNEATEWLEVAGQPVRGEAMRTAIRKAIRNNLRTLAAKHAKKCNSPELTFNALACYARQRKRKMKRS